MASMKINLLKDHHVLSEREYSRERSLLRYSVVGLVVLLFLMMAVFFWNFILANKLSGIESSITMASNQLKGLAEANAQQLYVKNRLSLISDFLADRAVSREALQQILTLQIEGVTIGGITYVGDNEVSVTVQANNAEILGRAIEYYKTENGFFPQVVAKGISLQKDGKYEMILILTIPASKNKEQ